MIFLFFNSINCDNDFFFIFRLVYPILNEIGLLFKSNESYLHKCEILTTHITYEISVNTYLMYAYM